MDRGAWKSAGHGVAKSRTGLSNLTFTFTKITFRIGDWGQSLEMKITESMCTLVPPKMIKAGFQWVSHFSCSVMSDSLWTHGLHARLSCPSPTPGAYSNSVMSSNHLILSHPLLLLPSIFPSLRVFSNQSALCIRWPTYWTFSFSMSPSNEYSGLISFRMDLLDLLAVQGTLKSLLQHHSFKASILWGSAFFIVQLSRSYMTTGKTISLTRRTFVGKVMSLLFNMLSRLVITFLPSSKLLLISWKSRIWVETKLMRQSPKALINNRDWTRCFCWCCW